MGKSISRSCCKCFGGESKDIEDSEITDRLNNLKPWIEDRTLESSSLRRHEETMEEVYEEFLGYLRGNDSDYKVVKSTDFITVKSKDSVVKSTWKIEFPARKFLDYLANIEERLKWNKNMVNIYTNERTVVYTTFKRISVVSPRDLVSFTREFEIDDGFLHLSCSVLDEEFPEREGFVRMVLHFGGYFIREINPQESMVTFINKVDIGGNLPKAMVNAMSALKMPEMAKDLNEYMKKYYVSE